MMDRRRAAPAAIASIVGLALVAATLRGGRAPHDVASLAAADGELLALRLGPLHVPGPVPDVGQQRRGLRRRGRGDLLQTLRPGHEARRRQRHAAQDVDAVISTFSLVEAAVSDTVRRFSERLGAERPDVAVHYLGLQRYNSSQYGHFCCGHPSIDKHKFMAQSIAANISASLGWNLVTQPLDIDVITTY